MDEKKGDKLLVFLVIVLMIAVLGLFFSLRLSTVGKAIETTTSQVVITAYLSIAMSNDLSAGIDFGTIGSLPAFQNATANYNSTGETQYSIDVSSDSNTPADFCIRATALNTTVGDEIPLANYLWSNSTINDNDNPSQALSRSMQETYVYASGGVVPGDSDYYRAWLGIDAGQPPGTYDNIVFFQGVPIGDPCI